MVILTQPTKFSTFLFFLFFFTTYNYNRCDLVLWKQSKDLINSKWKQIVVFTNIKDKAKLYE